MNGWVFSQGYANATFRATSAERTMALPKEIPTLQAETIRTAHQGIYFVTLIKAPA
jgi:hypothetical protein